MPFALRVEAINNLAAEDQLLTRLLLILVYIPLVVIAHTFAPIASMGAKRLYKRTHHLPFTTHHLPFTIRRSRYRHAPPLL